MKSVKLSMAAGELAPDTSAFVILKIDTKGMAFINGDATVQEMAFMKEVLSGFIQKLLNGEIK